MTYNNKKTPLMGVIMSNPTLSRQMKDAWFAKEGSTKRSQAKSTMRSINKIGQRRGLMDGMGGTTGSTTPAMGTTTEFANPLVTGSTAPRLGTYGPKDFKPQRAATYASRAIEEIPSYLGGFLQTALGADHLRTGYNFAKKAGAEVLELFGKDTKTGDKTWKDAMTEGTGYRRMHNSVDDILGPYDGVGEKIVNDIKMFVLGEKASQTEQEEWANASPKEVRDHFMAMKAIATDKEPTGEFAFSEGLTTDPTGTVTTVDPETGESVVTGTVVETAKKEEEVKNMYSTFVNSVFPDRQKYLDSLDTNGRAFADKMLEYIDAGFTQDMATGAIMRDVETLKKMFPGVPVDQLPMGAFAEEAIEEMRSTLEEEYKLKEQFDKLGELRRGGMNLEEDMIDYVKRKDNYISVIDTLLDKTLDNKYSGRQLTEREQILTDTYLNFLTKLKGNQEVKYIDWLERSSKAYERTYNIAKDRFDSTTQWIDYEMAKKEPLTRARYDTYKAYTDGMYSQLAVMSKNDRVRAAAQIDAAKSAFSGLETIVQLGKATESYFPADKAEEMRELLGTKEGLGDDADTGLYSDDYSTESKDVIKEIGKVNDQGKTEITVWDLNTAMNNAKDNKTNPASVANKWYEGAVATINNQGDYSVETMDKIESAMKTMMAQPDYASNQAKQNIVAKLNNNIYKAWVNKVRGLLDKDEDQVHDLYKLIERLGGVDRTDILDDAGSIKLDRYPKILDSWMPFDEINPNEDVGMKLYKYFAHMIKPKANVPDPLNPDEVFDMNGSEKDIVYAALSDWLNEATRGSTAQDFNSVVTSVADTMDKVEEEGSEADKILAETDEKRQEALDKTILGDLTGN